VSLGGNWSASVMCPTAGTVGNWSASVKRPGNWSASATCPTVGTFGIWSMARCEDCRWKIWRSKCYSMQTLQQDLITNSRTALRTRNLYFGKQFPRVSQIEKFMKLAYLSSSVTQYNVSGNSKNI